MFKKVLLTLVLALTYFSAIGLQGNAPPPLCGTQGHPPCPWVN